MKGASMKTILLASAVAFSLAGCAMTPEQLKVAEAKSARPANPNCKVYPMQTATIAGGQPRNVDSLQQRQAQAWLGTSDYRMRQLAQEGATPNNLEDALRDCNR
jgi:starvation-inducible outer membrane lipoprotein